MQSGIGRSAITVRRLAESPSSADLLSDVYPMGYTSRCGGGSPKPYVPPRGLTLFTADPAAWTEALSDMPATVPLTVVALTPPSGCTVAALTTAFEIDDRGAVVVRPDGHVVWRTRRGPTAADHLHVFIEHAWAEVYPNAEIALRRCHQVHGAARCPATPLARE